jgi:nitrous oxidase accessory protein
MNRLRVGAGLAAVMASGGLLLAAGPAAVVGPAAAATGEAAPARCAPSVDAGNAPSGTSPKTGTAGTPSMAEMPGMADNPTHHWTQELRDRLARTPSGGTLTVAPGVYRGALVIDRPVTLVGVGHPVIQGDGTGTVITIRAAGTTVRDLMVEGSGPGPVDNPAGVSVQADHVVVSGLHIRNSYTGVWVEGAKDAQVTGNVIEGRQKVAVSGETPASGHADMEGDMDGMAGMTMGTAHGKVQDGRGDGVSLFNAIRPVVSRNAITNVRDGVYLEYGSGTRIECNSVAGSRYAIHSMYGRTVTVADNYFATNQSGPVMMYGGPVTLEGNVIRDEQSAATGFGVLLLDVSGARLLRNVIVSNRVGLQIEGPLGDPRPTAVERNTIALNQVGFGLYPTANAVLTRNSFVENTVQVLGLGPDGGGGASTWSREGVGNYWSNYRGFERSSRGAGVSGIGGIPHVEGAAAGRLLAGDPTLLALASSPSFTLLRAVEQRSAGQHPVVVDSFPIMGPASPSLPSVPTHAALGTGLVGAASLVICSIVLLRSTRRRRHLSGRKKP